jgi:ketosteroid isomerase-like protein
VREFFASLFGSSVQYEFRFTERCVCRDGDIVWVFADGFLVSTSDAGRYEHPYRLTGVLRRHGDTWLWTQYHGSEPAG